MSKIKALNDLVDDVINLKIENDFRFIKNFPLTFKYISKDSEGKKVSVESKVLVSVTYIKECVVSLILEEVDEECTKVLSKVFQKLNYRNNSRISRYLRKDDLGNDTYIYNYIIPTSIIDTINLSINKVKEASKRSKDTLKTNESVIVDLSKPNDTIYSELSNIVYEKFYIQIYDFLNKITDLNKTVVSVLNKSSKLDITFNSLEESSDLTYGKGVEIFNVDTVSNEIFRYNKKPILFNSLEEAEAANSILSEQSKSLKKDEKTSFKNILKALQKLRLLRLSKDLHDNKKIKSNINYDISVISEELYDTTEHLINYLSVYLYLFNSKELTNIELNNNGYLTIQFEDGFSLDLRLNNINQRNFNYLYFLLKLKNYKKSTLTDTSQISGSLYVDGMHFLSNSLLINLKQKNNQDFDSFLLNVINNKEEGYLSFLKIFKDKTLELMSKDKINSTNPLTTSLYEPYSIPLIYNYFFGFKDVLDAQLLLNKRQSGYYGYGIHDKVYKNKEVMTSQFVFLFNVFSNNHSLVHQDGFDQRDAHIVAEIVRAHRNSILGKITLEGIDQKSPLFNFCHYNMFIFDYDFIYKHLCAYIGKNSSNRVIKALNDFRKHCNYMRSSFKEFLFSEEDFVNYEKIIQICQVWDKSYTDFIDNKLSVNKDAKTHTIDVSKLSLDDFKKYNAFWDPSENTITYTDESNGFSTRIVTGISEVINHVDEIQNIPNTNIGLEEEIVTTPTERTVITGSRSIFSENATERSQQVMAVVPIEDVREAFITGGRTSRTNAVDTLDEIITELRRVNNTNSNNG